MPQYQFNSQQYQPQYSASGGLPVGKHKVVIDKSEFAPMKENKGNMLKLTLKCIEGPLTGVAQIDNLNLQHTNPQTVEIANKQLSAYCHATGVYAFQTTEELHNKPFMVEIGVQKNNPDYTEVKALFDVNGNEIGKGGQQIQQSPASAPSAPPAGFAAASAPPQGFTPPAQGSQWGGQPQQPPAQAPQGQWGAPPAGQPPVQSQPAIDSNVAPPQQPTAPQGGGWPQQGQPQQPQGQWGGQPAQGGQGPWGAPQG